MIKLSRKVEYSLMALQYMAQKPKDSLTTAKELSQYFKVSFEVMARCLQKLSQNNLLKAQTGAQGGYLILNHWESTSILDLFEWVDGPSALVRCIKGKSHCHFSKQCGLVDPVIQLNQEIRAFFKNQTLGTLLLSSATFKEKFI